MSAPFSRSLQMMAEIAALSQTASGLRLEELISNLGMYTSRGHGGKHRANSKFGSVISYRRGWPGRDPHQGKKECARRVRQMAVTATTPAAQ